MMIHLTRSLFKQQVVSHQIYTGSVAKWGWMGTDVKEQLTMLRGGSDTHTHTHTQRVEVPSASHTRTVGSVRVSVTEW